MAPVGQVLGRELFSKTKMCKFHRMGKCTKGTQCPWAHGASEIKVAPDLSRTKLCRELITTGRCATVDCKYAHSKKECRTADFSQLHPVPAPKASTMHLPDVVPPPFSANSQDFIPIGFTAETPAFVPMPSPPPGLEDCVPYGPIWGYGRLHQEETESESSSNKDIMLNGNSPSAQTSSKRGLSRAEFASAGTSASLADL